jgi:hypothetical protein
MYHDPIVWDGEADPDGNHRHIVAKGWSRPERLRA